MKCALNARLLSVAEFVRQDATFADVGTDHAYLPLFLLESGRIRYAYCSDINEGPLACAERNAAERGMLDRIDFILTDGATALDGHGITDYAICGMGGELIADIIDRAPHLKDGGVNLILQPMSRVSYLRRFLASQGFRITGERYSRDAGKYYVCMFASYDGICRQIGDTEAELGLEISDGSDRDAEIGYFKARIAALTKIARGRTLGGLSDGGETELLSAIKERLANLGACED